MQYVLIKSNGRNSKTIYSMLCETKSFEDGFFKKQSAFVPLKSFVSPENPTVRAPRPLVRDSANIINLHVEKIHVINFFDI